MTVIFDGDSYIRNKKHRINRRRRTLKTHSARTYSTHVPSSPCNKSDRSAPFSKSLGSNPFCFAMSCADQKIRSYKSTTGRTFSSLAHIDSLIIRRTDFESRIHWNRNWKFESIRRLATKSYFQEADGYRRDSNPEVETLDLLELENFQILYLITM